MPLTKSESDKLSGIVESFKGGYTTMTPEQTELARKATFGDYIIQFGLSVDEARKFFNCVDLCERQHKAVGFRMKPLEESRKRLSEGPAIEKGIDKKKKVLVDTLYGMKSTPKTKKFKDMAAYEKWADSEDAENYTIKKVYNESHSRGGKLTESRLRKIVLHECSCMMGKPEEEVGDLVPMIMQKVVARLGDEEGGHDGYHPMPEGDGLAFEDSDPHEEAGMIKSNLYSITTKAQSMHDMIGDADDLPEWVQEKIAVCDEYMDVISDYLKYEYKRSHK